MSPFDTAVVSSYTQLSLAHWTKSMAHFTSFIGFPLAVIKHIATPGKHFVQPLNPLATHNPNFKKHLAFSIGFCASETHCRSEAWHSLTTSMIPLSVSPRWALCTARAKGAYASSSSMLLMLITCWSGGPLQSRKKNAQLNIFCRSTVGDLSPIALTMHVTHFATHCLNWSQSSS